MPENSGLVADRNEELNSLREELGSLIRELRTFIKGIRDGDFNDLDRLDIAEILEEIING
jgi:hypothetical protein